MSYFTELVKAILKSIQKHKRLQRARAILSKRDNSECITISNSKLHHRVIIPKAAWYWQKTNVNTNVTKLKMWRLTQVATAI
jgi:hypothetical protein